MWVWVGVGFHKQMKKKVNEQMNEQSKEQATKQRNKQTSKWVSKQASKFNNHSHLVGLRMKTNEQANQQKQKLIQTWHTIQLASPKCFRYVGRHWAGLIFKLAGPKWMFQKCWFLLLGRRTEMLIFVGLADGRTDVLMSGADLRKTQTSTRVLPRSSPF